MHTRLLQKNTMFKVSQESHADMSVVECGLVINPEWPHLGASPDGIVQCTCCGKGVLEIKCPYCNILKWMLLVACPKQHMGQFSWTDLMHTIIKYRHKFLYVKWNIVTFVNVHFLRQVQASTPKGFIPTVTSGIPAWNKATHFFRICILPEILGKWYTRPFSVQLQTNNKTGGLSEQCIPCTSTSEGWTRNFTVTANSQKME